VQRPCGTQRPQCGKPGHRERSRLGQINRPRNFGHRTNLDRDALCERTLRQSHHSRAHPGPALIARSLNHHPRGIRAEHAAQRNAAGAGVVEIAVVQREVPDPISAVVGPAVGSASSAMRMALGAAGSTMRAWIDTGGACYQIDSDETARKVPAP
jgi:hypothetical protein